MRTLTSLSILLLLLACKPSNKLILSETGVPVPQISWTEQTQDLGQIKKGEKRDLVYEFTNTGSADLVIELVTACNCMSLDWTRGKIIPGGEGMVKITFDSTHQELGKLKKVIDVIANTDPIVVEAFFNVEIVR